MKNVKFTVEVVKNRNRTPTWADYNPATGKMEGKFGNDIGVEEKDSMITKENGYTNIVTLPPGTSPEGYIDQRMKEIEKENK